MASSLLHAGSTLDPGEPLHIQVKAAMHMIKHVVHQHFDDVGSGRNETPH